MDAGFGPDEGNGTAVVAGDQVIDVVPALVDIGEAGAGEGAALEDGEPDLDLGEPGAVGRGEIEADFWVAGEPAFVLGLVDRKIVEDDVDLLAWIGGDDAVHEIEELDAPATLVMAGSDVAAEHVERDRAGRAALRSQQNDTGAPRLAVL